MCGSTTGNASPLAQVCGASTVNISLDSQAGPLYTRSGFYSTPWTPPYYDWGYQPYFPSPHVYTVPFSQHDTYVSPEAPACMPPPAAPPMDPPPMADDSSPFNLHFISGNISKCAGCGNKYVTPAVPPYDLCIQHRECSLSAGGVQQSKFAPAYYHVNTACIRRNWSSFSPEQISVASEVFSRLNPTHREYLFQHGFIRPLQTRL